MNPSRVRWGITLILIGLVFLANNLGGLSWWVWYDLMRLWPVLLIVIGLEIIVKRSKLQVLGYLSSILVIATFAYVIYDNRDGNDDGYGSYPSSRSEAVVNYAERVQPPISRSSLTMVGSISIPVKTTCFVPWPRIRDVVFI